MKKFLCCLLLILQVNTHLSGFFAQTPIQTPYGLAAIKSLEQDSRVWSAEPNGSLQENTVLVLTTSSLGSLIHFVIAGQELYVAPDQTLFVQDREWVQAQDIQEGDYLVTASHNSLVIKKRIVDFPSPTRAYYLALRNCPHTFLIGKKGFLAHNHFYIMIPLFSWFLGGEFTFMTVVGAATAATAVVVSFFSNKIRRNRHKNLIESHGTSKKDRDDNGCTVCDRPLIHPDEMHYIDPLRHPHGLYQRAPYHNPHKDTGRKSKAPENGQLALDNSWEKADSITARIGYSHNEIVELKQESPGIYHGFVVPWKSLTQKIQQNFTKSKITTASGRFL